MIGKMEILDLYNAKREKINRTVFREEEPKDGEYKLSVHVFFLNSKGELLIQKRNENLNRNPGKWAFTGGAVDAGETSEEGAIRETKEELGINIDKNKIELLLSFKREHGFVDVWLVKDDIDISNLTLNKSEVAEVKWVTIEEMKKLIEGGQFVKSIGLYYDLFIKLLEKCHNVKIN
jgi:8-oxo-dGTP pyrophosphatase MutT (NUDIX family)